MIPLYDAAAAEAELIYMYHAGLINHAEKRCHLTLLLAMHLND